MAGSDWAPAKDEICWVKFQNLPQWPCKVEELEEDGGKLMCDIVFYGDDTRETVNVKKLQPFRCEKYHLHKAKGIQYGQRTEQPFANALSQAEKERPDAPPREAAPPAAKPAKAKAPAVAAGAKRPSQPPAKKASHQQPSKKLKSAAKAKAQNKAPASSTKAGATKAKAGTQSKLGKAKRSTAPKAAPRRDADTSDDEDEDEDEGGGSGAGTRKAIPTALPDSEDSDSDAEDSELPTFSRQRTSSVESAGEPEFRVDQVVWAKMPHFQYWPAKVRKVTGKGKKVSLRVKMFNCPDQKAQTIKLEKSSADAKPFLPSIVPEHEALMEKALSCKSFKTRENGEGEEALIKAVEEAVQYVQRLAHSPDGKATHSDSGSETDEQSSDEETRVYQVPPPSKDISKGSPKLVGKKQVSTTTVVETTTTYVTKEVQETVTTVYKKRKASEDDEDDDFHDTDSDVPTQPTPEDPAGRNQDKRPRMQSMDDDEETAEHGQTMAVEPAEQRETAEQRQAREAAAERRRPFEELGKNDVNRIMDAHEQDLKDMAKCLRVCASGKKSRRILDWMTNDPQKKNALRSEIFIGPFSQRQIKWVQDKWTHKWKYNQIGSMMDLVNDVLVKESLACIVQDVQKCSYADVQAFMDQDFGVRSA